AVADKTISVQIAAIGDIRRAARFQRAILIYHRRPAQLRFIIYVRFPAVLLLALTVVCGTSSPATLIEVVRIECATARPEGWFRIGIVAFAIRAEDHAGIVVCAVLDRPVLILVFGPPERRLPIRVRLVISAILKIFGWRVLGIENRDQCFDPALDALPGLW